VDWTLVHNNYAKIDTTTTTIAVQKFSKVMLKYLTDSAVLFAPKEQCNSDIM